jgi:hypothetical protein
MPCQLWNEIRVEAQTIVDQDEFLGSRVKSLVLNYTDFPSSMSKILANHFAITSHVDEESWYNLLLSVYTESTLEGCSTPSSSPPNIEKNMLCHEITNLSNIGDVGLYDLCSIRERDPATSNLINPLLNFKGFKAIQAYRIAHHLWSKGRQNTALLIQSLVSDLFGIDIHPAATIGPGLMIDHGMYYESYSHTHHITHNYSFDRKWSRYW